MPGLVQTIALMKLGDVVVTSVERDHFRDGGADFQKLAQPAKKFKQKIRPTPRVVRGKATKAKANPEELALKSGGEEEDRTPDLRIANATLSQLSYPPTTELV